jgi:hypothetical protein
MSIRLLNYKLVYTYVYWLLALQCKEDIVVVRAQRDSIQIELAAVEGKVAGLEAELSSTTTKVCILYYTVYHHNILLSI